MIGRRTLLAGGAALLLPAAARSQATFPSRPVTIMVPYPAGGSVDLVARLIADPMARTLGQPVLVENRGGGGGSIATQLVARAEPDGHRIVLGTQQTHGTSEALIPGLGYRTLDSFAAICGIATVPHALVVRRELPARTAGELVALMRREPDRLNYGSTGNGSSSHLAAELFRLRAGVSARHVPYRGGAPLTQDLVAGVVDFGFVAVANIMGQLEAGQVRAIAVASSRRMPQLKDVPTLAEAGVPDVDADAWFAMFAPAGTPPDRIARLADATKQALGLTSVREVLERNGLVLSWRGTAAMPAFLAGEVAKWADVVRRAGVKADP